MSTGRGGAAAGAVLWLGGAQEQDQVPPASSVCHTPGGARAQNTSPSEAVEKYLPLVQWALRHAVGFGPQEGCVEAKVFWQIWNSVNLTETSA